VIPGDHDRGDTGAFAVPDRGQRPFPRRIDQGHQTQQGEIALRLGQVRGQLRQAAVGQGQDPEALVAQLFYPLAPFIAVKWPGSVEAEQRGAAIQQDLGSTFGKCQQAISFPVQRGHELAFRGEGNFGHPR
jgi:hypothetical protein